MSLGTLVAYRWEVRKLLAQKRTYIGIGAAALLPIVFVTVMGSSPAAPTTCRWDTTSVAPASRSRSSC
jgi:hypothetical protein